MSVHRMPISMKFLIPSLKKSTLVLFTVLLFIINIKCIVDGLSTANERGERKLFGGYRITPKFCKPSKILPKSDPRSSGPTICMFNHECSQRQGEVVGACMDGFLFGACCQLIGSSDTTLEDYNKPLLDSIDTLTDNENRITFSTISGGSDSILLESTKPLTSTDKPLTSIYLTSNAPDGMYSQELPSFGSDSFSSSEGPTIITSSNKKKVPNTKQPYPTKPTTTKYGNTDKYVLIQTLSNNKNKVSAKPGISENEISSIESIILMLNDTKTGPQYNTNSNKNEIFYITTKLPSITTKKPTIYNVTQTTSHISIYTPSPTSSSFATIFEKIPTFSGIVSTTKSPSTSYVYSTVIPKRPTITNSNNNNRISSTLITSNKPTKTSLIVAKKPAQKVTSKPLSTSYVSGPTPARPTYSTSKSPLYGSSQTEAPIINKIETPSTPAPTVIVLGPYGIGSTENPSPTIHITPKPTANLVSSSTSTIIDNDFDDSGYYGLTSTTNRPLIANIQQTVTSASIYALLDENALSGPITPSSVDLSNDLNNFPPVRNPNLNGTVPVSGVTIEDYDISTPQFIEDDLLNDKMGLLVNKIVESFKDNFHDLADIVENKTVYKKPFATTTIAQKPITTLPTKKPPQRFTTSTRRPETVATTTVRPNRRTTKKPITTLLVTKKPFSKVTTTRRPLTKPPKRQPTTTIQQQYDEVTDATEVEGEGENIGAENAEEEESTPFFESSRVQCGVRPHVKSGRIVGGKGATFGAWPWQVLVRESTWLGLFTKNKCGGVLITTEYVMTAAHCQPGFLATLVAVFGEFDISGDLEKKRSVTKNIERIVVHREYDAATFENDLALLKTESPVHYDTHIVPICMPADNADFTGRMATVTGWGRLKYAGGVPSVLQEVQVPIIENSVCQEMFQEGSHSKKILPSFLCAGYANGLKDSCEGDSGGPLVLQRTDGRWELAGTVSHGIKCAAPYLPGVYMRTTYYKPWLHSVTGV